MTGEMDVGFLRKMNNGGGKMQSDRKKREISWEEKETRNKGKITARVHNLCKIEELGP